MTALTSTAPTLTGLAMWRFTQGLLTHGIFIITTAYITEEWRPLQVPRVMSVYVAGTVFGGSLGRVAGGIGFCMLFTLVSVFSYITFSLADAPFHLSTTSLSALFPVYLVGLVVTLMAGIVLARLGLCNGMLTAIGLCLLGVSRYARLGRRALYLQVTAFCPDRSGNPAAGRADAVSSAFS